MSAESENNNGVNTVNERHFGRSRARRGGMAGYAPRPDMQQIAIGGSLGVGGVQGGFPVPPPSFPPPTLVHYTDVAPPPASVNFGQLSSQYRGIPAQADLNSRFEPFVFSASHTSQGNPFPRQEENFNIRRGDGASGGGSVNRRGRGRGSREFRPSGNFSEAVPFDPTLLEGEPCNEAGYGCPPSYLMEGVREEVDRQMAANAASAAWAARGRRHGRQTFPGEQRGRGMARGGRRSMLNPNALPFVPRLGNRNFETDRDGSLQNLRDRLKKQLEEENYECMICFQTIYANQWIWTCTQCFHMFHMNRANTYGCITQWAAKSFDAENGWRCPSCQQTYFEIPSQYRCFCGKRFNPPTQRFPDMPHSCNATCGKSRGNGCTHPCNEQCHPGPCPECPAMATRTCCCGAETKSVRCGTVPELKCEKVCGKLLNCGIHKCEVVCHSGECAVCEHVIIQKCHCGSEERVVPCTALNANVDSYSCGAPCSGMFSCGIHNCDLKCHSKKGREDCGVCVLSPSRKQHCPCGRVKVSDLGGEPREKCTDPVPTCNNICDKVLPCGSKEKPHRCKQVCHVGPCPPCPGNSSLTCRCKALKKTMPCKEFVLYSDANPFTCERRCRKQKSCQNHRCQALCCTDTEHVCMQICNKKLDCGNHTCDRLCHVGQCPRCLQASFEEQFCLCGRTVREPPIPCGSPLPPCNFPCSRHHPCGHPPLHNCHAEKECPPCTVLTHKPCYGNHEVRANIPCHLKEVSCGLPCDAALPCGVHRCKRICHAPPCVTAENGACKQICTVRRVGEACDHICGLPCHGTAPCPKSVCTEKVLVTCACLRKSAEMKCVNVEKAFQKSLMLRAVDNSEGSFNMEKRILQRSPSMDKYRCLPCDADCQRVQRNKRVAGALNIATDSDANSIAARGLPTAAPIYNDFLKLMLKKAYKQVLDIENELVDLVHNVDLQLYTSVVSHAFRPMNSELRRVIHEYASYFRVETVSYDSEPQRNVVATAKRGISCIPLVFLTGLVNPPTKPLGLLSLSGGKNEKGASSSEKGFVWNVEPVVFHPFVPVAGSSGTRNFAEAARGNDL